MNRRELTPALLRALEDPGRGFVAHWALWGFRPTAARRATSEPRPDGSILYTMAGLPVVLRPQAVGRYDEGGGFEVVPCTASIDPARLAAVRNDWHRRLDAPVGSVAHWQVVAATAVLPAGWASLRGRRAWVRRRRKAMGLCLRCGYDLRGNVSGTCPECGSSVGRKASE
jgi:hypothetical protein